MKIDYCFIKFSPSGKVFYSVPMFKVFYECSELGCIFNTEKRGCILESDEFRSSFMVMRGKSKRCRR